MEKLSQLQGFVKLFSFLYVLWCLWCPQLIQYLTALVQFVNISSDFVIPLPVQDSSICLALFYDPRHFTSDCHCSFEQSFFFEFSNHWHSHFMWSHFSCQDHNCGPSRPCRGLHDCAPGRLTLGSTFPPIFQHSFLLFKHVRFRFSSSTSSSFHRTPWPSSNISTALGKRNLETSVQSTPLSFDFH